MVKAKKIIEWILVVLFIVLAVSFASIQIYRAVVNSGWYTEMQARKGLESALEKVKDAENIKYIKVDDNIEERFVYDVPAELFDDAAVVNFENIKDVEKQFEIWKNPCVTVFFSDDTHTSFNITTDGKVYWGQAFELECPHLVNWYNDIINSDI